MKPINTKTHGVLDYLSVVTLLAVPRMLGWNSPIRRLTSIAALGTLVYSLFTHYELGLIKLLPMPMHLILDDSSGALFCAAPLLVKRAAFNQRAALVGFGLFEMAAAALTQPEPSDT